jgi:uncharacterized membrane protein YccC
MYVQTLPQQAQHPAQEAGSRHQGQTEADKKEKEFQIWQLRRQIEDAKAATEEMTALDAELAQLKEEAQHHNITPVSTNAPPPPPPPPRPRNPNAMDTS